MPLTVPPEYTPPSPGTYPNKPYPNYASGHGFTFTSRDPKKEMEYTAQLLSDILDPTGYWAEAELHVGTTLKTRYNDVVGTLNTNAKSFYDTLLNQIKTDVYGGTPTAPNVAYSQYLNGMSSAFGGGHSAVAAFNNLATQQMQLAVHEASQRTASTVMGLTYQATSSMPLVVPIESQLVSDACASAVEQYNFGTVRDQQVRQSIVLGDVLANVGPPAIIGNAPQTPADEVLAYASINAQGSAALQK